MHEAAFPVPTSNAGVHLTESPPQPSSLIPQANTGVPREEVTGLRSHNKLESQVC